MKQNKLLEFLEDKNEFEIDLRTLSHTDAQRKLLLGPTRAAKIDKKIPTNAEYTFDERGILRATYQIEDGLFTGIGVIDQGREFLTDEFNIYGFSYDVEFDGFMLELARYPLNGDGSEKLTVSNPNMDSSETRKLSALCISRAFIDLSTRQQSVFS